MNRATLLQIAAVILLSGTAARAQVGTDSSSSDDVEQVTTEASRTPEQPISTADRPLYDAIQRAKLELSEKYGFTFAIEDTMIYQATSGGVDPDDAMVNTLGLFATWKIFRSEDGVDFAGVGFQAETRGNHGGEFTEVRDDLGTLWSPNDSTSDDYSKINQLWWGGRLADRRFGFIVGKLDPGAYINTNRFAASGNTQYFSQPFATNPARSFPDNGLGFLLLVQPTDWLFFHFLMSDSEAVSTHSPFTTIQGRWLYAGEVGFKPVVEGLGEGVYRLMLYDRDDESAGEIGWALSADQNLSESYGVFLRYGGNDGDINSIEHILAGGLSFLEPFGRANDQAGIAISFTHPTSDDLRDEYSAEAYYRLQVTQGFELSASAQLIIDPSASDQDAVGVFGLRARLLY